MTPPDAPFDQEHEDLVSLIRKEVETLVAYHPNGWPKPKYERYFRTWRRVQRAVLLDTPEMIARTRELNRTRAGNDELELPREVWVMNVGWLYIGEDGELYTLRYKRIVLALTSADLSKANVLQLRSLLWSLQRIACSTTPAWS